MKVTIKNESSTPQHVPVAGITLQPGRSIVIERTSAQLDAEIGLKKEVQAGKLSLDFEADDYDGVATAPSA